MNASATFVQSWLPSCSAVSTLAKPLVSTVNPLLLSSMIYLFFIGLTHASASDAVLIANGETFFSVLLATAFFKEKLGKIGYLATVMIFTGIIIVTTDFNFAGFTLQQIHYQDWLLIISMLFWGN